MTSIHAVRRLLTRATSFAAVLVLGSALGCGGSSTTEGTDDGSVVDGSDDSAANDSVANDAPIDADGAAESGGVTDGGADGGADTSTCGPKTSCSGTCVDVAADPKNCGTCGHDCTTLPGVAASSVTCVGGRCNVAGACSTGRAHCTANPDDGCETDTTTAAHCGSCATKCAEPTPLCSMDMSGTYACASGCSGMTPTRCSGACVDTTSDPNHCGSCATVCPTSTGATATCAAGVCGSTCNTGFHRCGTVCASNTDPNTCGASCLPCAFVQNGMATCDGTSCGARCDIGYHQCGGYCFTGFETNRCGPSCTYCPAPANGAASCDGTSCGITCGVGYHPCGSVCASNYDLATCGTSCGCPAARPNAHQTCAAGACGDACDVGYHECGGACVPNLDPGTCGTSCTPCATPTNGTSTCNGFACGFTCTSGYHACGLSCSPSASLATCGTSCTPCPTPPHTTTPTCDGTSCGYTCLTGYADCDGNTANGCEVTLSDPLATAVFCDGFEAGLGNWGTDGRWSTYAMSATGNYSYNGYWGGNTATGCNITNRGWMAHPVDLRGYMTATLKFTDQVVAGSADSLLVFVSTNGGVSSTLLGASGPSAFWTPRTFDLTPYVGNASVQVRFVFQNICGDSDGVDWYVDDVLIMAK